MVLLNEKLSTGRGQTKILRTRGCLQKNDKNLKFEVIEEANYTLNGPEASNYFLRVGDNNFKITQKSYNDLINLEEDKSTKLTIELAEIDGEIVAEFLYSADSSACIPSTEEAGASSKTESQRKRKARKSRKTQKRKTTRKN